MASKVNPAAPRFSFSLNGPVPFIFDVHSPGLERSDGILYDLGRMIAWYVCCAVRYGKNPFGAARLNCTAFAPTFLTPTITPL